MTTPDAFVAPNRALAGIPNLDRLLGAPIFRRPQKGVRFQVVLAWGRKASSERAKLLGQRSGMPVWQVEDGFLRSVGLGFQEPPLSVVLDDLGIYYDVSTPSRLEMLIASPLSEGEFERAEKLRKEWVDSHASKYNTAREWEGRLPENYVLLVDQTLGDASISFGNADKKTFDRALEAALDENLGQSILLKTHPDVLAGKKQGCFDLEKLRKHPRIVVLAEEAHPVGLIAHASCVYSVTSQLGFEALLHGKRVRVFGQPFYAGWGLTVDDAEKIPRRSQVPLEQLLFGALVRYPRYLHPETLEPTNFEKVLAFIRLQRESRMRFPASIHAIGIPNAKHPWLRKFFQGSRLEFVKHRLGMPLGSDALVWGVECRKGGVKREDSVLRVEDGFLRSAGLGAAYAAPRSLIVDRLGIYFDPSRESELERILSTTSFSEQLLERAQNLRRLLLDAAVTKYNTGTREWSRPENISRVILVPGQVETDASIRFGAPGVQTNLELLRSVRENNPDAWVLYKPHPDVSAGLRAPGEEEARCSEFAHEVLDDVPMGGLLAQVDEVHTITSLAGFEGLLRGKNVEVFGQPFYSGWGLTTEHCPVQRRSRKLLLEELVAGALILYPTYISSTTGRFTTPERVIVELQEELGGGQKNADGVLPGLFRMLSGSPAWRYFAQRRDSRERRS